MKLIKKISNDREERLKCFSTPLFEFFCENFALSQSITSYLKHEAIRQLFFIALKGRNCYLLEEFRNYWINQNYKKDCVLCSCLNIGKIGIYLKLQITVTMPFFTKEDSVV